MPAGLVTCWKKQACSLPHYLRLLPYSICNSDSISHCCNIVRAYNACTIDCTERRCSGCCNVSVLCLLVPCNSSHDIHLPVLHLAVRQTRLMCLMADMTTTMHRETCTCQSPQEAFPGWPYKHRHNVQGPLQLIPHSLKTSYESHITLRCLCKADACNDWNDCSMSPGTKLYRHS